MTSPGTIRVGISGWSYPGWRGAFYPHGLPQKRELEYAAGCFGSIEINGSFYSLQRPARYAGWRDQIPEHTVFAVKGGRFITHMKRLRDVHVPLANFFASGVLALETKLGPILWQLPPQLAYDEALLEDFCAQLPSTTTAATELASHHDSKISDEIALTATDADRPIRHAIEVRHDSFRSDAALATFRKHDVALVVADTAGRWPLVEQTTTDFMYVRLHGDQEIYVSGYTEQAITSWAGKMVRWRDQGLDVYAYFDNDVKVRAPYDGLALMQRCGLQP